MSEVIRKGQAAKAASYLLSGVSTEEKNNALSLIGNQLLTDQTIILEENQKDIQEGIENGLTDAVLDRIRLNETRIKDMAQAINLLIELEDPIGEVLEEIEKENGLLIQKSEYLSV